MHVVDVIAPAIKDGLKYVRMTEVDRNTNRVDGRLGTVLQVEEGPSQVGMSSEDGEVHVEMIDGHLILAGRRAPFFDGRYVIVVTSEATPWRTSGLTCLLFE